MLAVGLALTARRRDSDITAIWRSGIEPAVTELPVTKRTHAFTLHSRRRTRHRRRQSLSSVRINICYYRYIYAYIVVIACV